MKRVFVILMLAFVVAACAPALPPRDGGNATDIVEAPAEELENPSDAPEDQAPAADPKPVDVPEEPESAGDIPVKKVTEGDLVSFPNLRAVDPDGDPITYTFTSPLDEDGKWQTDEGDSGDYRVTISASDGVNNVAQEVLIKVLPKNKPPVIEFQDSIDIAEGETLVIDPVVTDAEGDEVTVSFSGWMSSSTKELSYDDEGSHSVVITASDGSREAQKEVIVNVANTNRAPSLEVVDTVTVTEKETVSLGTAVNDPDGDKVSVAFEQPFDAGGKWTTQVGDAGEYEFTVTATDGSDNVERKVVVIVEALNSAPTIEMSNVVEVKEGETVTLNPTVRDKEGDDFTVTYSGWMSSNSKKTGFEDAGEYDVTITATDSNGNSRDLGIKVKVADVNRPPSFGNDAFI